VLETSVKVWRSTRVGNVLRVQTNDRDPLTCNVQSTPSQRCVSIPIDQE